MRRDANKQEQGGARADETDKGRRAAGESTEHSKLHLRELHHPRLLFHLPSAAYCACVGGTEADGYSPVKLPSYRPNQTPTNRQQWAVLVPSASATTRQS
jgi:hypothetical protein